jgi:hypothetical protein
MGGLTAHAPPTGLEDFATADTSWISDATGLIQGHSTSSDAIGVLIQPKGPEFLERLGGLAAGLGVKNQQMLPTGMGHIEAASVQIKLADLGVTHVDDAGAVADIRARPQLAEALTGS